ncbi:hypothetical protein HYY70_00225, partial [Candidatus Woesearchaeota archaeon]|nr:hypothetical protein [Candidatus Woesearchaeota archaeon]
PNAGFGNVGIGTTNPTAQLHVIGTINATSINFSAEEKPAIKILFANDATAAAISSYAEPSGTDMLYGSNLRYTDSPNSALAKFDITQAAVGIQMRSSDGYIVFHTSQDGAADYKRMIISPTGQIGINTSNTTTTPAQTLTVQGTLNVTPAGQGSTPSIFVNSTGQVGIGTATPQYTLQVSGSQTSNALVINASSGFAGISSTTAPNTILAVGTSQFALNAETPKGMILQQQLGPVTGTNAMMLDVSGSFIPAANAVANYYGIRVFPAVYDATSTNITYSAIRIPPFNSGCSTGNCINSTALYIENQATAANNSYGIYVAGATNYSILVDSGTSRFDGNTYLAVDSGSVGIGTSNPSYRLHILDTTSNGLAITSTGGSGETAPSLYFDNSNDGIEWNITSRVSPVRLEFKSNLKNVPLTLTDPGNVGINTTTPTETLHVVGTMLLQAGFISNETAGPILNISNSTGQTNCFFDSVGNFFCKGTKSAVVDTSYAQRKLFAVESPDVRHIDEGRAKLTNGFANVSIDPIFKETIEGNYNVYLTPEGKTKALYVHEKTRDYFIVKDTASTNAVFSYIISAYRKGYESKRFDSGSEISIVATVDETAKVTDVEVKGSSEQDNSINNQTTANLSSNSITGNAINELGLETDLSNILEPSGNATSPTGTSTPQTTSVILENNSSSASGESATTDQTTDTIQEQTEEQAIYGNKIIEIAENKFTINSIDEDEIIEKIKEKTKLEKDKIKRAIKFKKKEPVKPEIEDDIEEEQIVTTTVVQQAQMPYITKVNGSVIIRIG